MPRIVVVGLMASLIGGSLLTSMPVEARSRVGTQSMESCVGRVLARLGRARAPSSQVGRAVVSSCDRQLQASLAASIRSGEAAMCTVESCIGMARQRAAEEATAAYRQRFGR